MKLHDYQHVAVDHLRRVGRGALFLDMGLGKTACALTALTPEHLPALVIAPKRVAETVWDTEAALWAPGLTVEKAVGRPQQRAAALASGADLVVLGRDNVADAVPLAGRFRTVIIDELSSFKRVSGVRARAVRKITARAAFVWGLTGTPTPNGYVDLYAQIGLIDGGKALGTRKADFVTRWFEPAFTLPNGVVAKYRPKPGAAAEIDALLEDICLSMTTDGRVHLPELVMNTVVTPLPAHALKVYRAMKRDMLAGLDLLDEVHTASSAAVLSTKLAQVTAGFLYPDEPGGRTEHLHREKPGAVEEVVEGTGSPVLVFYRFAEELKMLAASAARLGVDLATMRTPDVVEKWNAGDLPLLAAHPQSAGHGLNLQRGPGHTVAWTTPTWSLEEWQQANKRLHRQGQQHTVTVHQVTVPRSIDEQVYRALDDKRDVQDALLRHLESPL